MAAIICSGIILKKTKAFAGDPAPFVMELPAYHIPAWGNVFRATWERGWSFIKRAGSVILAATVVLWFLQGFGFENGAFTMVEDQDNSILAIVASAISWIFIPQGFGNWRATVASISGLIAKENVVGTFGVLYHFGGELSENGDEIWNLVAADYTALSAYAFMIFNLLCAPCFAAMGAIKREMNNGKWTAFAIGYMCALAYCSALVVYQLGGIITGELSFNFFTIVAAVILVAFIYLMVRPNKYVNDNEVKIDEEAKTFEINGHKFVEGDWISIDGSTGNIYGEQVATVAATGNKNFNRFMGWADAARQLLVMTNADNPRDAQQAVDLGAEGIGLCRTEHMFFAEDRIKAVREMICARTVEEREAALAKVEPFQQGDFEAMYRIMGERPMTIRYLDPPLHEFLPTKDEDIKELAADMGMTFDDLKNVVASLHEFNPMMGHRGCRLAVTYPEIAAMQTRAVIKAALNVSAETGYVITPHIMIPLVGEVKELKFVKDVVVKVADELIKASGVDMKYLVGTMIEIPRAALTAGEIAKEAEFFSFGTNDLTQMTFGFSRDDAAKFLGAYYENKIYESDPFQHLDQVGVGKLVKMAAHDGRETRPDLGLGICGEHGGDPSSVEFCHNVGLDYVSCSPFRVPIARLAAAQAAIKNPRK